MPVCMSAVPRSGLGPRSARGVVERLLVRAQRVPEPALRAAEVAERDGQAEDVGDVAGSAPGPAADSV